MLKANVHPRVVQEMLGHANISQTMDTYSHVLPNMQQAAERMDEMLGQGRGPSRNCTICRHRGN